MAKAIRKTTQRATLTQPISPLKPVEKDDFYNMPDSTASNLILETLGAGANIADLPSRKRQINRSTTLEVLESGKSRRVTLSGSKSRVTIELADIDKLTGSNKPAKKLFVLSLIKANEQAIHGGQLTRDYITFPLQELVDIGFYKSLRSARTGFNSGMDALTSLKVKGYAQKSKRRGDKGIAVDSLEVLFTGAKIENNQCFVRFNYAIDWGFIVQYFTILPKYYFALPNRASDLLYYIFYLARQRTKDIEERGYFTIGFRAIQSRLQLPSEICNTDPKRTIKQPIEDAIEQIEDAHSATYQNMEFGLLPVCDETAPIAEYLDNGYLQVSLKGAFAGSFIEISKDAAKQIEAARKKASRISERAIAANIAKKMEQDNQGADGSAPKT